MQPIKFFLYTCAGAAIWTGALAHLGYVLGEHFKKLAIIAIWYSARVAGGRRASRQSR